MVNMEQELEILNWPVKYAVPDTCALYVYVADIGMYMQIYLDEGVTGQQQLFGKKFMQIITGQIQSQISQVASEK